MIQQTVNKTILIHAPVSHVWEALTNPKQMPLWMSEPEMQMIVTTDWKIGNPIITRGDLHGIPFENKGTVLELEAGKLLKYSYWSSLSQQEDKPENYAVIEFRLSTENDQTKLTLTQNGFVAQTTFKHWEFYWNVALEMLRQLLIKKEPA